jgi:hypothetical protein
MKCHNINCENSDPTQQSGCFLHNKVIVKYCNRKIIIKPIKEEYESYDRQDDYETDFEVEI